MTNNQQTDQTNIQMVNIEGENYFKISNNHLMRPFFMNIVSDANHWMFISSNGGLTAGRKNSEFALFPYYTDDKVTDMADITGSKTIIRVTKNEENFVWEPFMIQYCGTFSISRNLYKSVYGNKVIFEEINHTLGLTYSYRWSFSNSYGFIRKSLLENISNQALEIHVLDGLQNILPASVHSDLQSSTSNLVDAYKRNELHQKTGLAIYSLSSIISDKAEPNESLKANIVYSLGLTNSEFLLSSRQLNAFRKNKNIENETDVKGEKGAYFIQNNLLLQNENSCSWMIVGEVNQSHIQVANILQSIQSNKNLLQNIEDDIFQSTQNLKSLVASADGLQYTADHLMDARHFSNVLFNIMRGGIFDDNYKIEKNDFGAYLVNASKPVYDRSSTFLSNLPSTFSKSILDNLLADHDDVDLVRLSKEYLPLKFSRRHGDPSRPWNKFSINTVHEETGSKILDYEGNWRDIFQNWEGLVHSYPEFIEAMIYKFLNASTFDGYNPYRVTKDGFDWETIEPDNPWSYIGYWGDHQIIYLLKFLEYYYQKNPKSFKTLLVQENFVYANVPYRIKTYHDLLKDPKNTIDFDEESDLTIRKKIAEQGADGALLTDKSDKIHHVNFIEKILATVLAKMSNFIPDGGIWMNTQRPDWNDANNALVGNGISMVNLYYLRRFLDFFEPIVSADLNTDILISKELYTYFQSIHHTLEEYKNLIVGKFSGEDRKSLLDDLGKAASLYRQQIYTSGFSGNTSTISMLEISKFVKIARQYLDHTITNNKRPDNLYHAYNLMSVQGEKINIDRLDEMLEGQVAALSSGYLKAINAVELLDALANSRLYREDQHSYILYPNKNLPGFLEKNTINHDAVNKSTLLKKLLEDKNTSIIQQDVEGKYHFNSNFKNAGDLQLALQKIKETGYAALVENDNKLILEIFEDTFHHASFTGRSGTFFAYEGLGSIYWHMVSKLHLAVQEVYLTAIKNKENPSILEKLKHHYTEIGKGIGVHKSPDVYGAFPTDAYSHTPYHKGAQQPGMTGQVKEDILVNIGAWGIHLQNNVVSFNPILLEKNVFVQESQLITYFDLHSKEQQLKLETGSAFFTYCQVPIIYSISTKDEIVITTYQDGNSQTIQGLNLPEKISTQLFKREGNIQKIQVYLNQNFITSQISVT